MKFFTLFFRNVLTVLIISLLTISFAQAQETRVGHVASDRIMRDSALAKAAEAKIEREFSGRDKELSAMADRLKGMAAELDKDAPQLAESERMKRQRELADLDREFQRKQQSFRQDLVQRKNEEALAIVTRAQKAIKKIAEAEKFDIILQDAIYVSPRIDITDKVLKALNKK